MSPGVMRLIFGGFAVVMAGVAVNTLLLQPEVPPALANVLLPVPTAPARTATVPATPAPSTPTPTTPSIAELKAPRPPAAPVVSRDAPIAPTPAAPSIAPESIRVAHMTTDSTQPARMPRLPEIEGDPDVILRVQKELLARGYGPVVANGIIGPLSRAAIMAYEHDSGLPITGEATEILLKRMREGSTSHRQPSAEVRKIRSPEAEQVVRTVQHSLTTLGYEPGRINGRMSDDTERAIRAFEAAHNLQPTGRVSAELFSLLARAMGARSAKASP